MDDSRNFPLLDSRTTATGWLFDVEVPSGSPFFTGHFPGEPVLPAIAQLRMLTELYRGVATPGAEIGGVEHLRLQNPVLPGARLEVALGRPDEQGRTAFSIRIGTRLATRGRLRWIEERSA